MKITTLIQEEYPTAITAIFGANAPKEITVAGNTELLRNKKLGLLYFADIFYNLTISHSVPIYKRRI